MSSSRQIETQARIDAQAAIVASLEPNSLGHRVATKVLLLLQDSLHLLNEVETLLAEQVVKRKAAE